MIGAHLGTLLDTMRDDEDGIALFLDARNMEPSSSYDLLTKLADVIHDAAEHDEHDEHHNGAWRHDCWFCYNETQQFGARWAFEGIPVRRVQDGES